MIPWEPCRILSRIASLFVALLLSAAPAQEPPTFEPERLAQTSHWLDFSALRGIGPCEVDDLVEGSDGTPWIATEKGAAWYDGHRWQLAHDEDGEPLPPLNALARLPDGQLVGAGSSGVFELTRERTAPLLSFETSDPRIGQALHLTREGELILYAGDRYAKRCLRTGVTTPIEPPPPNFNSLSSSDGGAAIGLLSEHRVLMLRNSRWVEVAAFPEGAEVFEGTFHQATGVGLAWVPQPREHRGIWEWREGEPPRRVSETGTYSVLRLGLGPRGEAIVFLDNGGVHARAHADAAWEVLQPGKAPLHGLRMLRFRSNGDLWTNDWSGLRLWRSSMRPWREGLQAPRLPLDLNVMSLLAGGEGDLWLGTAWGVLRTTRDGEQTLWGPSNGVDLLFPTTLCQDSTDAVWAASGTGIMRSVRRYDGTRWEDMGESLDLPTHVLHAIVEDEQQRLWFLPLGRPSKNPREAAPRAHWLQDDELRPLPPPVAGQDTRYYDMCEAADGSLFFATSKGLLRHADPEASPEPVEGLRTRRVFTVVRGPDGRPWFAHQTAAPGIGRVLADGSVQYLPPPEFAFEPRICDLAFDEDGTLWALSERGLWSVNGERWTHHRTSSPATSRLQAVTCNGDQVVVASSTCGASALHASEIEDVDLKLEILQPTSVEEETRLSWALTAAWGATPGESLRTRYAIDDGPFRSWSRRSRVQLPLPPGTHELRVEGVDVARPDSPIYASRTFEVPDPVIRSRLLLLPLLLAGVMCAVLGTALLTRRKREELRLRESEAKYRTLVEASPDAVLIFREGSLVFLNPSARSMLAASQGPDPIGSAPDVLDTGDLEQGIAALDAQVRLTREPANVADLRIRKLDGTPLWVDVIGSSIRYEQAISTQMVLRDVTERREQLMRREHLMRELDHRVKNNLAGVLALFEQSLERAHSVDELRLSITGRVRAMARAHEALAASHWEGVPLRELVRLIVAPHTSDAGRLKVRGPDVVLPSPQCSPLSMALHELATNASKYGALSWIEGEVYVLWTVEEGRLRMVWDERGGPAVEPPSELGFGMSILRGMVEHDLGGKLSTEFRQDGLRADLDIPYSSHPAQLTS